MLTLSFVAHDPKPDSGHRAATRSQVRELPLGVCADLRHSRIHLRIQHEALLCGWFVARADANRRLATAINAHVKDVGWNVDVVTRSGHFAMLKLIACPHLDLAADYVKCGFMPLMNVRTRSDAGRQRDGT